MPEETKQKDGSYRQPKPGNKIAYPEAVGYVQNQLERYLRSRAIDTSRHFTCINPIHEDHVGSMSLDIARQKANCPVCNADYGIIDIIAIEYGLGYEDAIERSFQIFGLNVEVETYPQTETLEYGYDTVDSASPIDAGHYNTATGAIGAFVGAAVGSIPWMFAYNYGWYVGFFGYIIGYCAIRGYLMLKGKPGGRAVLIIIAAIVFGVAFGQLLPDFLMIIKMVGNGEIAGARYSDIFTLYLYLVSQSPSYVSSTIGNLVLGLVFAGIGTYKMLGNMVRMG
ncbi:MAG: hypothetical protein FWG10_12160 [Eubacteriaceae bacterium]|nr:hypothetical protein [Eubacteriaceae bacterium]